MCVCVRSYVAAFVPLLLSLEFFKVPTHVFESSLLLLVPLLLLLGNI